MSQREFLQELDADMHEAFADAGIADAGSYTAPGDGAPTQPCRVYVNRDILVYGSVGEIIGARTEVVVLRADIEQPVQKALLAIDGELFKLGQQIGQDESMTRWVVTTVSAP